MPTLSNAHALGSIANSASPPVEWNWFEDPHQDRPTRRSATILIITDKASQVLREVTGHPRLAATSGLRVARKHPASDSLGVKAVSGPEPGDQIVERADGRLFLCPVALRRLRGNVLDARDDAEGRIHFVLRSASAARGAGANTSARSSA